MMTQNRLPFQYEKEDTASNLTAFAGLPLYIELMQASGFIQEAKVLNLKKQGWSDSQILTSLIMLNIAGGDCVEDINRLEKDKGLKRLLQASETHGMKLPDRMAYQKLWRKRHDRSLPSASSIYRYLENFHNAKAEQVRLEGSSYIPEKNAALVALKSLNKSLLAKAQQHNLMKIATLDQDATLSESHKRTAKYSYKKYQAYQPFNTYWHEQDLLLHSEFRDGNVHAGFEQLRVLQESLAFIPQGVEQVRLRSDSAGYQKDLLRYCAEGKDARFGVIEFTIAARVTSDFKAACLAVDPSDWQPIYQEDDQGNKIQTEQEWAEVCFVPSWMNKRSPSVSYRYIGLREKMYEQKVLPGLAEVALPFQTLNDENQRYKIFGIVSNRDLPGNELIQWHRGRCGASEKVHSVQKSDLAGGQFPSSKFGANAAWWQIMVLAYNINSLMKAFVLPAHLKRKRLKALRFHLICLPARMIAHARRLVLKLDVGEQTVQLLQEARRRIAVLAQAPPQVMMG